MKLRDFVDLYDNWNGILVVNDDNLDPIVKRRLLPSASTTTNFV